MGNLFCYTLLFLQPSHSLVSLCPKQGKAPPLLFSLCSSSEGNIVSQGRSCTMETKNRTYLFVLVFASLLLSSMAGGQRMFSDKDSVQAETTETSESMQQDEVMVHARILKVQTNDYGTYDPSPSMSKPRSKDIPN